MKKITNQLFFILFFYQLNAQTLEVANNKYAFNGAVEDMVKDNLGNIYLGGYFTEVGLWSGNFLKLNSTDGQLDNAMPKVAGNIYTILPIPTGGWYIGGDFTHINGKARNRLARINADGSLHPFNPNINNTVRALALDNDGNLFVGGGFTTVNGNISRNYLCKFDNTGTLTNFNPNPSSNINTLALDQDANLYVGGYFSRIGNTQRNYLCKFDNTGGLTSFNPNMNSIVYRLAFDTNGNLYVGGGFTTVNGTTRNRLCKFDNMGTLTGFNPNISSVVVTLALDAIGNLYVGGAFSTVNGMARSYLCKFDNMGTLTNFAPNLSSNVEELVLDNVGNLYIGGGFYTVNNTNRRFLCKFDNTGLLTNFDPNVNGLVYALAVDTNGNLFVGGKITSIGATTTTRNHLCKFDSAGNLTSFDPNFDGEVSSLVLDNNNNLYVGGDFTTVGVTTPRNQLCKFDNNGVLTNFDPSINGWVYALAVDGNNNLYVGGNFSSVGTDSTVRNNLCKFDNMGVLTSFNPNINQDVYALAVDGNNNLYIGGLFSSVGSGTVRNNFCKYTNTGALTNFDPNLNGLVSALHIDNNGNLYISGFFSTIGNTIPRGRLCKFDNTGALTSFNPIIDGLARKFEVDSDGNLYVGGSFSTIGGNIMRKNMCKFDNTGVLTNFSINFNGAVNSFLFDNNGNLHIGGSYSAPSAFYSIFPAPIPCTAPTAYSLTGGGTYCTGGTGVAIGLANSQSGMTYQLQKDNVDVGIAVNGTGTAISFGNQTATGTYTVVATNTSGGCTANMNSSVVVTASLCCPSGATLYVNNSVTSGTGDGTSWTNACSSLSDALALAHTCNGSIQTIKVAAGTYKPTKKPFDSSGVETTTSNNRDKTFHIPIGVTLEGGYNAATGNRDITANVTTLSGDFNNDDVINGGGTTLNITGNTENAYHVVVISAPNNSSVVTKIDGITIIGGYANEFGSVQAGSINISKNKGGGLYAQNGTNILTNNTVMGNGASSFGSGGGIYIINGTNTLTNNKIYKNAVIGDNGVGGGICLEGGLNTVTNNVSYQNLVTGFNCRGGGIRFIDNTNTVTNNTLYENSVQTGGGMSFSGGTNNIATNNIIYGNTTSLFGGGISVESENNITLANNIVYNNVSSSGGGISLNIGTNTLANNLIYNNTSESGGGVYTWNGSNVLTSNTIYNNSAIYYGGGFYTYLSTNLVSNCIFWKNKIDTSSNVQFSDITSISTNTNTFTNNLFQLSNNNYTITNNGFSNIGTNPMGNIFNKDPLFVNTTNPAGIDGVYNTADDGFALQTCSPAVNIGLNSTVNTISTDIIGQNRIRQSVVDMGAYESNHVTTPSVSVSVTNNCGSSTLSATAGMTSYAWSNNAATADITVSTAGTYTLTVTAPNGCPVYASGITTPKEVPTLYSITGGGYYCNVSEAIGISNSQIGVNYQLLKDNSTLINTIVAGTGAALSFGNQTDGNYSVVATNTASGCSATTPTSVISALKAKSISLSNLSGCNNPNNSGSTSDDYCTANITVNFNYVPSSGYLTLSRDGTVIASKNATELVNYTSWTFTGVQMAADGQDIYLTVDFGDNCPVTSNNLGKAPSACSMSAVLSGTASICAGASTAIAVTVTNGQSPYTVVFTDGTNNTTITNYSSGASIVVSPLSTKNYTLASVIDASLTTGRISGTATITVDESLASINLATVPNNVTVDCNNIPTAPTVTATNVCSSVTLSETSTKGTDNTQCSFYNYTITRTWTATDKRGNTDTASQLIVVKNNGVSSLSPVANITVTEPAIPTTLNLAPNNCMVINSFTYTDTRVNGTPPPCFTYAYTLNRIWTIKDLCENTINMPQTINVRGIRLTCPSDKTINTNQDAVADYNSSTLIIASLGLTPVFLDNCSLSTLRYEMSGATTQVGSGSVSGTVLQKGTTQIKYNLLHNGPDFCTFNIMVKDNEVPKITVTPTSVVDGCTFADIAPNNYLPMAIDNATANPTLEVMSDVTADISGCSTKTATLKYTKSLTRTWKATDENGNTAIATQKFFLRDMLAPTANCKIPTVVVGNTNVVYAANNFNDGSSDNCTSSSSLTFKACLNANCTSFQPNVTLTKAMIPAGANQADVTVNVQVLDACNNASVKTTKVTLKRPGTMANPNNGNNSSIDTQDTESNIPTEASNVPTVQGEMKCYPTPFMEDLNIQYNLTETIETITLKLYDNQGRLVKTMEQAEQLAGFYQVRWNLSDLQAGMYHVCLELNGKCTKMERVIMMK